MFASHNESSGRWLVLGLTFLVGVALAGCQAPLEQKKGLSGEFCNGSDSQCQSPLLCVDSVCQSLNDSPEVCRDVCAKFEQCNAGLNRCYDNCTETLKTWSKEKAEQYRQCNVNLSCAKIQDSGAPQNICYGQLELAEVRLDRCKTLRENAERCLANAGDYDSRIKSFFDQCRRKGRTVAEARWKGTKKCEDFATGNETQCGKMFNCINSNFKIDKDFPTSKPDQQ